MNDLLRERRWHLAFGIPRIGIDFQGFLEDHRIIHGHPIVIVVVCASITSDLKRDPDLEPTSNFVPTRASVGVL